MTRQVRVSDAAPVISVITPTYNRAHTLTRLYQSLVEQTNSDFEWVIVDDGSDDDTGLLVRGWVRAGDLDIVYRYQRNSGMHVAFNRGVSIARGALSTIVDSDDWLPANALAEMLACWNSIGAEARATFSGVVGLTMYEDGSVIGDRYPADPLDCDPVELTYLYGVAGDKHGLLRSEVYREFPFPFEDLRSPVANALVWNRMALKYRERHVNRVFKVVEYQPGGLTDRARELSIEAAPATRQFFLEEAALPHPLPRRTRLRSYANYVRYSFHTDVGLARQAREAPSRARWAALLPLGAMLYVRDLWRMRGQERGSFKTGTRR